MWSTKNIIYTEKIKCKYSEVEQIYKYLLKLKLVY